MLHKRRVPTSCQQGLGIIIISLCMVGRVAAREYFVAAGGSDTAAGTAPAPWATVQRAADVVNPGDVVSIGPGTYRQRVFISRAGTSTAAITFRGEPGAVFESVDATQNPEGITVGGSSSYIHLSGIVAHGYGVAVSLRVGAHDVSVDACDLSQNRVGMTLNGVSQIAVSQCQQHDNHRAGLRITGATHDVTVTDTASFNQTDGLGCSGESDGFVSDSAEVFNVTFERVRSYNNSEDDFDMFGSNLVFDRVESRNACAGFKLRDTSTLTNCIVSGNRTGIETTAFRNDTQ